MSSASTSGKCTDNLTIGVEMEFYACIPSNYLITPQQHIYNLLTTPVPIQCKNPTCDQAHTLRLPFIVKKDRKEDAAAPWGKDYSGWNVAHDTSVTLTSEELETIRHADIQHGSIELISRIMNFEGETPCPHGQILPCTGKLLQWTWRDEITAVSDVLTKAFQKPNHRLVVPNSAGLHVHVGRGSQGFDISVVKGLIATHLAFERVFDSLLPTNRISGYACGNKGPDTRDIALPGKVDTTSTAYAYHPSSSTNAEAMLEKAGNWCKPMSTPFFAKLSQHLKACIETPGVSIDDVAMWLQFMSVPGMLQAVFQEDDVLELGKYFVPHATVLNFENLKAFCPVALPCHNTIEFRAHQGTLCVVEITAWIDFVGRLTLWCSSSSNSTSTTISSFLESNWANPDFTFLDLVREVGVRTSTLQHYTSFLQPSYANTRHDIRTSPSRNPAGDELVAFTALMSLNRLSVSARVAVEAKIKRKLDGGMYGQFPRQFLAVKAPDMLGNSTAVTQESFLCLDGCDFELWAEFQMWYVFHTD